jgi:hypothetical protein
VDGVIEEREMGEFDHGNVQGLINTWFLLRRKRFGLYPVI